MVMKTMMIILSGKIRTHRIQIEILKTINTLTPRT